MQLLGGRVCELERRRMAGHGSESGAGHRRGEPAGRIFDKAADRRRSGERRDRDDLLAAADGPAAAELRQRRADQRLKAAGMNRRNDFRRARGFGIVEVLVAMVVGMLAVAAITAVFWSSEAQKRTITSGADASENGLVALSPLERDARVAGLGLMEIACTAVNGSNANAGG